MKLSDIRKVLILGAGTMGQQIGFMCAWHGYQVMLYDISREILDKAVKGMEKLGSSWFVPMGRMTPEQLRETLGRISATTDPAEAAHDADIISESVPEDPALKAKVFAQFHALCPERTIFTTNTSYLLPSKFAKATLRPERLCALHFHDVRTTTVVDVMPHPGTDPAVTQVVDEFARSIGCIVVMLHQENGGYVFNAMISNLILTALNLASRGVASVQDIDRAWMGVTFMPVGPFGIMDQIGLRTVWTITDFWAKKMKNEQSQASADFLKAYVDRGELGQKTKKGFYSYPDPAYTAPDFLSRGFVKKEG
jgi:3-hydroxybutyryl-CoA dehydrogenase